MPSRSARVAWYVVMIFSAAGLLALEIISRDYSTNFYVELAIVAVLSNPLARGVKLILWLLEPKVEKEPPKQHTQVPERVLTEEEMREQRLARIEATNKLKDINASKNWERSHNVEPGKS